MSKAQAPAQGFDAKRFMSYVRRVGHGGTLGIAYVDHGPDWAELVLPYDEKLIGMPDSGIIASGPIISLMDMATSVAIWCRLDQFRHQATLDLRVDYLRPATPGRRVIGRGECYAVTRSVAFVRGTAHDGDATDPVAHVTGTFMFTD
ncbi:MAG: PaaI family thioesterase [Alphaproteobacteria bacterium]|nr:PaaI family thioesterase [Alphaproteobacteria bacterium]